jgi:divalent metal cation (Fe/Co/Zn/Cd) transporter
MVERSEEYMARIIGRRVAITRGIKNCHVVSVHMTKKRPVVTMNVTLDSNLRFEDVHRRISEIETEVRSILPGARVVVQIEPLGLDQEHVWRLVKEVAEKVPGSRGVNNIHVQHIDGKLCVDLHLEVSANMTVKQAHDVASRVERELKAGDPSIAEITVHMESASDIISRELAGADTQLELYIEHIVKRFPEIRDVHGIKIRNVGGKVHLVLNCHFDPDLSMGQAHKIAGELENTIKSEYANVERVDVHQEPD